MIERLGGIVAGCAFLIELDELKGREKKSEITITRYLCIIDKKTVLGAVFFICYIKLTIAS